MPQQLNTVILTMPMFRVAGADSILVKSDALQLQEVHPAFLYGLHGTSKLQFITPFVRAAIDERRGYNLVDLTLKLVEDTDEKHVNGTNLDKVTMLSAKHMRSDLAVGIGELWRKVLTEGPKRRAALTTNVDWGKPRDFMQVFPSAAAGLFERPELPNLKLIILPMRSKMTVEPIWIGMFPIAGSHDFVKAGSVKMRDTQVRLPMETGGKPGGYYALPLTARGSAR